MVAPPRPGKASWVGTAWFGPWWLVYRGPVTPTTWHGHHALQALSGVSVLVEVLGETLAAPTCIAPNVRHRVVRGEDDAVLVYIDGDVARGREVSDPERWTGAASSPACWADAAGLAEMVSPPARSLLAEPKLVRAARLALADGDGRPLEQLAHDLGISPSRLSHLFRATVGTPMRSYRRWQRLVLAAEAIAGGAALTPAAHAAGFADGPHLARTFRNHFGLSVRELTGGIRFETA